MGLAKQTLSKLREAEDIIFILWRGFAVLNKVLEGAYIKYVGGGPRGFYKFFKKNFVAQETIDLNISWPSNFFRKYFMAPPINFSFLFKTYL